MLQKENMELQIYDSVVRGGGVSPYCHTVAVFPHDQQRFLSIWPTSPQTGSDGGGIFSNESDFKSFTYLFICPSGSSAFARRQRDRILFFFFHFGFGVDNSVNKHQNGGRKRGVLGSRKADGAWICVRCQTAPQNTSTHWDWHTDARNKIPADVCWSDLTVTLQTDSGKHCANGAISVCLGDACLNCCPDCALISTKNHIFLMWCTDVLPSWAVFTDCCDWHNNNVGRGLSPLSAASLRILIFVEFSSHTLSVQMAKPRKFCLFSQCGHLFLSLGRCHQCIDADWWM